MLPGAMRLHVNIDHVATLRNARGGRAPDPVAAAAACELAGAHGITCHLREDRRHITDRDVRLLREQVLTLINLEMAATDEMIGIALATKPEIVTLVPEKRQERTTEGGLDLAGGGPKLGEAIRCLGDAGIEVSLFIDPELEQVDRARALGAPRIELHTGDYAHARGRAQAAELVRLGRAAAAGVAAGLHVAAGHGLDYPNVAAVAALPGVDELDIGHAIIARAVFCGLDRAVADMLALVVPHPGANTAPPPPPQATR
jgi:pyridoxine 5-phosphate synthase